MGILAPASGGGSGASTDPLTPNQVSEGMPQWRNYPAVPLRSSGDLTGTLPTVPTSLRNLASIDLGSGAGVHTDSSRAALWFRATNPTVITGMMLVFNVSSGTVSWVDNGWGTGTSPLTNGLCLETFTGDPGAAGVLQTATARFGTGLATYGAGTGILNNRFWRENAATATDARITISNSRWVIPFNMADAWGGPLVIPAGGGLRLVSQDTLTGGGMARIELFVARREYV